MKPRISFVIIFLLALIVSYRISVSPGTVYRPPAAACISASSVIAMPDLYASGNGFTCTGLAYDASDGTFLVGDIGLLQPDAAVMKSRILRFTADFKTVVERIPLYEFFPSMSDVQGITIDTGDRSIWFCSPGDNSVLHITKDGVCLDSFQIAGPTGISYSQEDNSLWILTYAGEILHTDLHGKVLASHRFAYDETPDQCFFDSSRKLLYITAGSNYTSENHVYLFDITSGIQSIAYTVDSYAVEGIWVDEDRMIILNDGYYHSAAVPVNQANIYTLE